jgi:hypothetical protein
MKNILLLILAILVNIVALAQVKAVTETGEEVILYENGTWKYLDDDLNSPSEIPLNENTFEKNEESTFLLKSTVLNVGFWLNPKDWTFSKPDDNPDAEYELKLKSGDLYGMIITEQIKIPLETLRAVALENGRSVAPDLYIAKEEYRMVNGLKVLFMQLNGTISGIEFAYYSYYYSNENGTVQFITYTFMDLLDDFMPESEKLLNGFVELE